MHKMEKDPDSVKVMILNGDIDVVNDTDELGKTTLQCAAAVGAYEVAQLCLNLGADPTRTDLEGHDAIYWAKACRQYHVEQLLLFATLKGNAREQIQGTAVNITTQDGIVENMIKQLSKYDDDSRQFFQDTLLSMMENLIESKLVFSDDLLNLCLRFECSKATNILDTKIWQCISKTCTDIIQSGSKLDWFWLKNAMLPSTIWFKNLKEEEDTKPVYLYYELLKLVQDQAKAGLDTLDKNLQKLADQDKKAWHELIEWQLGDKLKHGAVRRDAVSSAITPKYDQQQLFGASSATFNVHSFYDYNEYLPQLVLLAQMVDDEFHKSVQRIFDIDKKTMAANLNANRDDENDPEQKQDAAEDGLIQYSRGPVKLIDRARSKAQNDYADQGYPTSACVLDFNRCSLIFNDIATMLKAINLFANKVKYYQSGCIIAIVRDKNGFKEYVKETQYADIKLNVLIKGKTNCIIGEVQFLLNTMKKFKEKAHNLYSIQRQQEYFDECVSPILPLLLDGDKQVGIAANLDDVKAMCRWMVFSNKTEDDITKIEEIWSNICRHGNANMLRFLGATMSSELLAKGVGWVYVEEMFERNDHLTVRTALSIDAVRCRYQSKENERQREKLICTAISHCDAILMEYALRTLNVSDEELVSLMLEPRKSHRDARIPVHFLVGEGKRKQLEYLLSFAHIRKRCMRDKEVLFRIVGWLRRHIGNLHVSRKKSRSERIAFAQYVVKTLELDEATLKELQSYKYEKPADWETYKLHEEKYWEPRWQITDKAISMILSQNEEDYEPAVDESTEKD